MNTELPVYTPLSDARIKALTALAKKDSATIHIIPRRSFALEWYKHCSGTIFRCDVKHKFKDHLSSTRVETDIVLLNYSILNHGSWDKAEQYQLQMGLTGLYQREILEIGEQDPCVFKNLGVIVAAVNFDDYGFYYAWWNNTERGAGSVSARVAGRSCDWFAFRV